MKPGIVDIHTHLLYGIDDGARNLEMSLKLIGMDYEQGVRRIFCTNHSKGMKRMSGDYQIRLRELQRLSAERYPELSLYPGCEIRCGRWSMAGIIRRLDNGTFPSLNRSRYVLLEFSPDRCRGIKEMIWCLDYVIDAGYIPVLAHVERYAGIYESPAEDLHMLKEKGCMAQINLYSVVQDHGRKNSGKRKELANLFLQNHLVDFVGTDTHRLDYKAPQAKTGAQMLKKIYGAAYADQVLYKNAEKLLIRTK